MYLLNCALLSLSMHSPPSATLHFDTYQNIIRSKLHVIRGTFVQCLCWDQSCRFKGETLSLKDYPQKHFHGGWRIYHVQSTDHRGLLESHQHHIWTADWIQKREKHPAHVSGMISMQHTRCVWCACYETFVSLEKASEEQSLKMGSFRLWRIGNAGKFWGTWRGY